MGKKPKDGGTQVQTKSRTDFREGDVVVVPDKSKLGDGTSREGTVWMLVHIDGGTDVAVLDVTGLIHLVKPHELYHVQAAEPAYEGEDEEEQDEEPTPTPSSELQSQATH